MKAPVPPMLTKLVLAFGAFITLASVIAFLQVQQPSSSPPILSPQPHHTIPPSTTPPQDETANCPPRTATDLKTANWKTYSNQSLGFSIKYPPDIKIALLQNNEVVFAFDNNASEIHESITVNNKQTTPEEWANLGDSSVIEKKCSLNVDGEKAVQIDTTEFGRTLIGARHNGRFYIFTTTGWMINTGILSTFKFLP